MEDCGKGVSMVHCCVTAENVCITVGTAASAEAFPSSDRERFNMWQGSESASEVCLGTDRVTASVCVTEENVAC